MKLLVNGGLYVVERVKRGIYSLSKLARWVHEGDLVVAAKGWHKSGPGEDVMAVDEPSTIPDGFDWWAAAQIDEPTSGLGVGEKPAGLSIALVFGPTEPDLEAVNASFGVEEYSVPSFALPRTLDAAEEDPFTDSKPQTLSDPDHAMHVDGTENHMEDVQQSPEELLDGVRDHYLQTLYTSKVTNISCLFLNSFVADDF